MTTPYSRDLRKRVLRAADRGVETGVIAKLLDVSSSWVRRVKQRQRENGETEHCKMGSPGVRKFDREELLRLVTDRPDATLPELRELLSVKVSESAISQALVAMGLSSRKRRSTRRSRSARMSRCGAANGAKEVPRPTRAG